MYNVFENDKISIILKLLFEKIIPINANVLNYLVGFLDKVALL